MTRHTPTTDQCGNCSIWQNFAADPETAQTAYCIVQQKRKHRTATPCTHWRHPTP